jgi:hypothetical protein
MNLFLWAVAVYFSLAIIEKIYLLASQKAESPGITSIAVIIDGVLLGWTAHILLSS